MRDQYRAELNFDGSESFVLNDAKQGETVAVFVCGNHAEEAEEYVAWKNRSGWSGIAEFGLFAVAVVLAIAAIVSMQR